MVDATVAQLGAGTAGTFVVGCGARLGQGPGYGSPSAAGASPRIAIGCTSGVDLLCWRRRIDGSRSSASASSGGERVLRGAGGWIGAYPYRRRSTGPALQEPSTRPVQSRTSRGPCPRHAHAPDDQAIEDVVYLVLHQNRCLGAAVRPAAAWRAARTPSEANPHVPSGSRPKRPRPGSTPRDGTPTTPPTRSARRDRPSDLVQRLLLGRCGPQRVELGDR